jgi:hypothetical protein
VFEFCDELMNYRDYLLALYKRECVHDYWEVIVVILVNNIRNMVTGLCTWVLRKASWTSPGVRTCGGQTSGCDTWG